MPLRDFQLLDPFREVTRQFGPIDLPAERDRGMGRGDNDVGPEFLARFERDAAHLSVADVDARDGRVGANRCTIGQRRVAQRAAHATHTALGKPPRSELAVADIADLVVRHDVRGTRRARAGPRPDHTADCEHALHLR